MENHQLQEQFLEALLGASLGEVMEAYQRLREAGVMLPEMKVCRAAKEQTPRKSVPSLFSGSDSSQILEEKQHYNGPSS